MAKDDYHIIATKILVYLYRLLKEETTQKIDEYLQPYTDDFPVTKDYFNYVLEELTESGLIKGVKIVRAWGGDVVMVNITSKIRITPAGIDYLRENSTVQKIIRSIPMAASIAELFM